MGYSWILPTGFNRNTDQVVAEGMLGLESDSTFWRNCVRYEFTHKNPPPHAIQPLPDGVHSVHRSRQHLRGRSVHAEGDGPEPDPARRHLFGIRVFVRVHANSRRLAG